MLALLWTGASDDLRKCVNIRFSERNSDMARDHRKEYADRKARIAAGTIGEKPGRPQNTSEILWAKVDKRDSDECWPWIGTITKSGYGRTWIGDKGYYAHRVIFNLANPGMIELRAPTNKKARGFLMHLCDNRVCCNPAHLRVANLRENNLDMREKGRVKHKTGEDHHRSVFTNSQIDEIMSLRNNGKTMRMIAEKMTAKLATIKSLIRRKTYA
jgi:hypothetical protein